MRGATRNAQRDVPQVPRTYPRYEHELACDAASAEQLVGASRVDKRKPGDEGLDRALAETLEQREEILAKQGWSQPFQPLDAVQHDPLAAGQKPTTRDEQTEDCDWTNAMTPARSARRSLSLDGRRQTIGHHRPSCTERLP